MSIVEESSDLSFAGDINSDKQVLVEFWAEWCGPCHAVAPVLDQLADELEDQVTVTKLNVDENPETVKEFGVRSIPALLLFKDGQLVETFNGVQSRNTLANSILENAA